MGYSGLAKIDGAQFLVTSMNVPEARVKLDSSSAYSGSINPLYPTRGLYTPRTYDYPANDGSIGFDMAAGFGTIIKNWILNRKSSREIFYVPCSGSSQQFEECFWSNISMNASEGSAVSGDISFTAVTRDEEIIGSNYIADRTGQITCEEITALLPLNPDAAQVAPVPFWRSSIDGNIMTGAKPVSWTLNFNQEITRHFLCEAYSDPQPPSIIGIGKMTCELQIELFIVPGTTYDLEESVFTPLTINIGEGTDFVLSSLDLQDHSHGLKGLSDASTMSITYHAYAMAA